MTESTKPALPISDPHHVAPTFVNDLVARGIFNGNVNLTFAAALFTPRPDGTVDPDLTIVARLRMDLRCAAGLYLALGDLLKQASPPVGQNAAESVDAAAAPGALN